MKKPSCGRCFCFTTEKAFVTKLKRTMVNLYIKKLCFAQMRQNNPASRMRTHGSLFIKTSQNNNATCYKKQVQPLL